MSERRSDAGAGDKEWISQKLIPGKKRVGTYDLAGLKGLSSPPFTCLAFPAWPISLGICALDTNAPRYFCAKVSDHNVRLGEKRTEQERVYLLRSVSCFRIFKTGTR